MNRTLVALGALVLALTLVLPAAGSGGASPVVGTAAAQADLNSVAVSVPYSGGGAAIFGDSGSAVRVGTGLAAAGDLTHVVVDTTWLPSFIAGTRIGKIEQIAGGWSLVSSPLCL